jgi:ribosomal protein S18 acetylase RimI-like enzyme
MHDPIMMRRATLGDCDILAVLGEQTFRETFVEGFALNYPAHDLAQFLAQSYAPDAFAAKLSDPAQAIWLAFAGAEPVGYANAGPCRLPHPEAEPHHGELYRLYVVQGQQGRALGRRLMETALAWLDREGPSPLWLGVWSGNLKAQAFYARYGFEKVGEYEFPVGATLDHEFILRRPGGWGCLAKGPGDGK